MLRIKKHSGRKGYILISSLFVTVLLSSLSFLVYSRSMHEFKLVTREIDRTKAYYIAEAGIQNVMAQIGSNAYTGFILVDPNTGASILDENYQGNISISYFNDVFGYLTGHFSVDIDYIDGADYVILEAQGGSGSEQRTLEARVFLESNFSKYLLFVDYDTFGSGNNAVYAEPTGDPDHPEGVAPHLDIRPNLYFTGDYRIPGSNVQIYGDTAVEGGITESTATSKVHGDTYIGAFQTDEFGMPINDGIAGDVAVRDGYKDDPDLDGDGIGPNPGDPDDPDDYPDRHDLANSMIDTLPSVDQAFYENPAHNSIPAFGTSGFQDRYLELVPAPTGGDFTTVREYDNFGYSTQVASYNLPKNAIVYVDGDIHLKGEIQGRISFVSSDDIHFRDNVRYSGASVAADPSHSAAFLASDKLFFVPTNVTVSGIFFGQNKNNNSTAFDASKKVNSTNTDYTSSGSKSYLRVHGNRLIVGQSNLSIYTDREYLYDPGLRKYRPPGLPVEPALRLVREI